jgi:hypothetical protein
MGNVSNPDVYSANAACSDYLSCLWNSDVHRILNGNLSVNLEELIFEELHWAGLLSLERIVECGAER